LSAEGLVPTRRNRLGTLPKLLATAFKEGREASGALSTVLGVLRRDMELLLV
jgi:hypothetical protein